jgi:NCS1 family nucleobase:cation symporter-1
VYFFMNLSGYMGQKTGVPFPVISRISLRHPRRADPGADPRGDRHRLVRHPDLPGLGGAARAADRRLAASGRLRPRLILGLSSLGWVCFVAIWLVQLVILAYGMEMVRRYEAFAGPVILLTVAAWRCSCTSRPMRASPGRSRR